MTRSVAEITLPMISGDGRQVAEIRLVGSVFGGSVSPILVLSDAEAKAWNEERVQLLEGHSYDYELRSSVHGSGLRPGVARKSGLSTELIERGRVEPGSFTGVLQLILDGSTGSQLATAVLEVRSIKVDYRSHYRTMLDDIALKTIDLLLDLRSPVNSWLRNKTNDKPSTIIQRFLFVRHLLQGPDFRTALAQILRTPHERTRLVEEDTPASRGSRGTGSLFRQIARDHPRVMLPDGHPLKPRLPTVPKNLTVTRPQPTYDTPENRFVKAVLQTFVEFLNYVERELSRSSPALYRHAIIDSQTVRAQLSHYLAHPIFKSVGRPTNSAPLGSPVLQRKSGYREVLHAWAAFNLAASLEWDGADDVYLGGKKDVATLYEYWVLFQLLDAASAVFEFPSVAELINYSSGELSLKLKAGRSLAIHGTCNTSSGVLAARLSYNRSFRRAPCPSDDLERSFPLPGSWTRAMRPDYTISIWPALMSEGDAELSEKIAHLHFDAKYRMDSILQLFGGEGSLDDAVEDEGRAQARRSDLLKMHSYKDAIRRSVSAYVLYPGTENQKWREYEEIVPGIGAFSISPGRNDGKTTIRAFLCDAAEHLGTRFLSS